MPRQTFSGQEVAKALSKWDFIPVDREGSHLKLRYEHPEGEVRQVTIPLHDELHIGTLRNIAKQAGAKDFNSFCEEIENLI